MSGDNHPASGVFHTLSPILYQTGDKMTYAFECPGCKMLHQVHVGRPNHPSWNFNGDPNKPTFTPSLLVTYNWRKEEKRCHSFITDGRIQFLSDCTHDLAGQTVDIPNLEDYDEHSD